jgi:hypothetical protein
MSNDRVLAAIDLKQYAINLLDSVGDEIDQQFDKWAKPHVGFLDSLCAAHGDAADDQVGYLKEDAEDKRRAFERAMFVLSLLQLGATDWLGAAIELRLAPKLVQEYEKIPIKLPERWITDMRERGTLKRAQTDIQRKVFGDFSNDMTDLVYSFASQKLVPPFGFEPLNPKKAAYAPDAKTFAHEIYVEVDRQQKAVKQIVNHFKEKLNGSSEAGGQIVDKVLKENKQLKNPDLKAIMNAGRKFLDGLFDTYRNQWATEWYFYAYDPPQPRWSKVRRNLEGQIWAVWVVQQDFAVAAMGGDLYRIAGASGRLEGSGGFASTIKESPIVTHLFEDFNAPITDMLLKGDTWDTVQECREQILKLNKWAADMDQTVLRGELQGKKRTLKASGQMW